MDFAFTTDEATFLDEFRGYLDGLDVTEVTTEGDVDLQEVGPKGRAFLREMGGAGWLGVGWPREFGGQGRSAIEQWIVKEELEYRSLPHGGMAVGAIGPTIMRWGSPEQKSEFLPRIIGGELEFALGYTEPNAGSDLAALSTRAARDGNDYLVNGQKVYTTTAHHADYVWLAVRTGAPGSRHRGISILIVPMTAAGLTIRPLYTQSGGRTNEIFLDDVRVPVSNRIGPENEGWKIIAMALDFERLLPYSGNRRYFEILVDWARSGGNDGRPVADEPTVRHKLARLAAHVEVARLLALRTAWMVDTGAVPQAEASMVKVWLSELRQHLALDALSLMGEDGQLGCGQAGAPAEGVFDRVYRTSTVTKFAGGTNEIQRGIIAQRGLGLPR